MGLMASVKIKGIPEVKASVRNLFNEVRKDPKLLEDIGIKMVEQTQAFNRSGKSVSGDKHPRIESETVDRKEKLKKVNPVSEYYRRAASNVTFTGQLLRSIKFKVFSSEGTVKLEASGERKPYKNLDGTSVSADNTPTNEQLVGYLKKKGHSVFGEGNVLDKRIENTITKIVRVFMNNKIRKSIFKVE